MTIPNAGPEHPDPHDPAARRGNPALALDGDLGIDDVRAATTRASTVSHRFGGVRHTLSRPVTPPEAAPENEDGESDPGE